MFRLERRGDFLQLAVGAGEETSHGGEIAGSGGYFDGATQSLKAMGAKISARAPDGVREARDGRSVGRGQRLVQVGDGLRSVLEEQFDEVIQQFSAFAVRQSA